MPWKCLLGGFPFTAFGHQTETGWTTVDGIPAVEADLVGRWAAGHGAATCLGRRGLFFRRIQLASVNLGGPEDITLRLALPPGPCKAARGWFVRENAQCRMALGLASDAPAGHAGRAARSDRPVAHCPGQTVTVNTLLLAQIPPHRLKAGRRSPPLRPVHPFPRRRELGGLQGRRFARPKRGKPGPQRLPCGRATTHVQEIFDKARFGLAAMVADNGVMDAGIFEYGAMGARQFQYLAGSGSCGPFERLDAVLLTSSNTWSVRTARR